MDTRTIEVETNSVQLRLPDNFTYYQYDVVFSPVDPRGREPGASKKVKLFHKLQNKVAPTVFNPRMIYDRQKLAYCPVQLSFSGNASGSFFVHLNQDEVTPQTKGAYRIILTPTAGEVIHRNDINELLVPGNNTQQALAPRVRGEKAKNVLQLIVRQGPNLRYQTNNGRAYFSGNRGEFRDVEDTKRGIELWRGIFLTVRPALNRMILTVDTCSTAVFRGGSLIDFCLEFLNPRDRNPQARHLDLEEKSPDFKKLEKILSRVRVTVRTDKQGSRPKIIRGLVPHGGRFEFEKGDQTTTVERYFFETHNTRIQYPNIIGVSFERKNADRQNVVPAELCSIEPGQICNRIPDELRPNMVKFSAMKPGDRKKRIVNEINDYIRSEYLAESRLGLERQLIKVQGKQLMAPSVVYGSGPVQPRPDGSWNVLKKQLLEVRDLTNWAVLNVCTTQVNAQQCKNYMINLMNCCKSLGMSVQPPCDMGQSNPFSVEKGLDDLLRIAQRNQLDPKRFIIVVLLEQDAGPTRTRVKYWGDVQHGVMTQCLRFGKFNTDNNQYWNNVAIKLNARLGGTNSRAGSSFWDNVMNQLGAYMVMGADVGHPSPGTQKPSVTSLVYSWDRYAAKYAAMTGIQHPRQEIIENIRDYVTKAMSNFVDVNNRPPASIFFFRDGVSEGEFQTVSKHERDELQAAIDDLWRKHQVKAQKPKITFVIVTKRHHSVFFPNSANPKDNCPPGMVVENGVTTPLLQNFYLQSHTAIQGTSRSSHYIVLQDDNFNYESNRLQHLCYHLCHVYAKATRSVSIPAPVYYADLVCSRLMFHLNPSVRLPTDDGASTASGESNQFDISVWKEAFQTLNQSLTPRMYFL